MDALIRDLFRVMTPPRNWHRCVDCGQVRGTVHLGRGVWLCESCAKKLKELQNGARADPRTEG